MSTPLNFPFYGVATVQTVAGLPTNCPDGALVLSLDTYTFWVYNLTLNTWAQFTVQGVYANGNSGATPALNFNNGIKQSFTMTANATFTFSNPKVGATYVLELTQDGTGSRTYTWPAAVKWPGGSAPSASGASKIDMITLFYDGTSYLGTSSLNY